MKSVRSIIKEAQLGFADAFLQRAKMWGVCLPHELPPEFMVTRHAEHRLKERLFIGSSEEMKNHIIAAWYSKTHVPQEIKKDRRYTPPPWSGTLQYRIYRQRLYIFDERLNRKYQCMQKHLITVYDISHKL